MQMAAIAKRSMAERLAEFEALNRAGNQMEADGIRRANPEFTDRQVFLPWFGGATAMSWHAKCGPKSTRLS